MTGKPDVPYSTTIAIIKQFTLSTWDDHPCLMTPMVNNNNYNNIIINVILDLSRGQEMLTIAHMWDVTLNVIEQEFRDL